MRGRLRENIAEAGADPVAVEIQEAVLNNRRMIEKFVLANHRMQLDYFHASALRHIVEEPLVERPSSSAAAGGTATAEPASENPAAMSYDSDDDEWVL